MIIIKSIKVASILFATPLEIKYEKNLASDIKSWLLTNKGIICEVEVK